MNTLPTSHLTGALGLVDIPAIFTQQLLTQSSTTWRLCNLCFSSSSIRPLRKHSILSEPASHDRLTSLFPPPHTNRSRTLCRRRRQTRASNLSDPHYFNAKWARRSCWLPHQQQHHHRIRRQLPYEFHTPSTSSTREPKASC